MITIKEIAEQLGLSTTTVSNVIHGKTGEVSAETIGRVQAYLEKVNYIPNMGARNLARNQSRIICLVLKEWGEKYPNIFADPFVAQMLGGVEKAIRSTGYYLMVYISDDIAEILNFVSTWNADGLILFSMLDDDALRVRKRYRKPLVCIDTYATPEAKDLVNIGLEDEESTYRAIRFLLDRGHRRIGFMTDNRIGVDLARFRGYRRALEEAGIEYSDRNFFLLKQRAEDRVPSLRDMIGRVRDYSAVFCCSDLYAAELMKVCYEEGIRVPEELSVMGFDDNPLAELTCPGLTTVHQDAERKGYLAAEMLFKMIDGEDLAGKNIRLSTTLVERGSVKRLLT